MQKKLTLRLDESLADKAKHYAAMHGKSVSQLVADYFSFLEADFEPEEITLGKNTQKLKGLLSSANTDDESYDRYRDEKFR